MPHAVVLVPDYWEPLQGSRPRQQWLACSTLFHHTLDTSGHPAPTGYPDLHWVEALRQHRLRRFVQRPPTAHQLQLGRGVPLRDTQPLEQ